MENKSSGKIKKFLVFIIIFVLTSALSASGWFLYNYYQKSTRDDIVIASLAKDSDKFANEKDQLKTELSTTQTELVTLKSEDQYKKNIELEKENKSIHDNYLKTAEVYEKILDLRQAKKTDKIDETFALALKHLADRKYASAEASLKTLESQIKTEKDKQITAFKVPENLPVASTPPSSGYRRQQVQTDSGTFMVDIVSADLNSTRVIVDTASESDCHDNCPVMSLSEYVSRSGAYAGINGSYFCPTAYPSCAGKTNSFDTLLMNKNKYYFNSDNNVYSTVPAAIFSGSSARFVRQSLEWGRDTGVDAVIANFPLLTFNNQNIFEGSSDVKHTSRGPRGFVGASGSTAYIGIVYNATVGEAAKVLHTMGVENSINLDSGGSTALWAGGYKAGPGRSIPNAILFVRK